MTLSQYHQKFANQPIEAVSEKMAVKEKELRKIVEETGFIPTSDTLKVGILGCADARYISAHKELFQKVFKHKAELITFDIATEHLKGENGVIEHDCTLPLPIQGFVILFSHVLLPFIDISKQADVVLNAHNALASKGMAIHIVNLKDIEGESTTVDWKNIQAKLKDHGIGYQVIAISHRKGEGVALITRHD